MKAKTVHEQASRLLANRKIAARVAAWHKRAAEEAVLDRSWVLKRLMRNVRIAMGEETVKLRVRSAKADGIEEFEITDRDAAAANRALELLGKTPELALFIERREVGKAGEFDHLSNEDLMKCIAEETEALGIIGNGERKYSVD